MTPTPDDIRKAREIASQITGGEIGPSEFSDTEMAPIAQALAEEREAERERCAGIAEDEKVWAHCSITSHTAREIAAAIRRSEP